MTIRLTIDRDRWWNHVSFVAGDVTGLVPVVKGNGYGLGRIELARFINPSGLVAIGQNQYLETPASGQPILGFPDEYGFGGLLQGALETSNVEIVQEMTDMIAAQRAYEINARAIMAADEMMRLTNDIVR